MKKVTVLLLFIFLNLVSILVPNLAMAETQTEKETRLRSELARIEAEQIETEKILNQTKTQTASLERDLAIINANIKSAQLKIQAKNISIQSISKDISDKDKTISHLEGRINLGKDSLAQMLQKTYQLDSYSVPELLLSGNGLATLTEDFDDFQSIRRSLKDTFDVLRENQSKTEEEKTVLDKRKNAELDAKTEIEAAKRVIEENEKQKKTILSISKNTERTYDAILADKRRKAAEIRAALFSLRDTTAIPFEVALKYANEASRATGIRPAFLLAIFAQESSFDSSDSTFGKQVGSCYITNYKTGAGASVNSGRTFTNVMPPGPPISTRDDITPFIRITKALNLDYTKTLVSCPQAVGWGGAMGPAQFIPTTWALYEERIKKALDISVPNPWNPEHAFVAASMLLVDNGAVAGSYTAERNAACRYYSGRLCDPKSVNMVYGSQVMAKAMNIQETMINPLLDL